MNLLGLEVKFANRNGKYVKQEECHRAQNEIKSYMDKRLLEMKSDIIDHFNIRLEDFKDFLIKSRG